jgi:transcriptional regulator with XRE-family HTH domain
MGNLPAHIGAQIKALIQTKGLTIKDISEISGIHKSRLFGFFKGANDLRGDKLVRLLSSVGISVEKSIQQELANTINGEQESNSLGSDLEIILDALSPLEQKTLLSTIIRKANMSYAHDINDALQRVEDYKERITFKRRGVC